MTPFGRGARRLAVAAAALVAGGSAQGGGGADASTVLLLCQEPDAVYCEALRSELQRRWPAITVLSDPAGPAGLSLSLHVTRISENAISGRLSWEAPDGSRGEGPEVQVSSVDSPLRERAPGDLARGLLKVTELPL